LDQKTEEEFAVLHRLNDQFDITYTHNPDNSNKLLLANLLRNCHIFSSKNQAQLSRLMGMLNRLYLVGGGTLNEISYWQFKEIYETAHGVAEAGVITKFVLTYLGFDEFGEVSRTEVFRLLEVAVSSRGRSLELIKGIVWNWLERTRLVENGALRKSSLEIWY
jgi:hypothetical protein